MRIEYVLTESNHNKPDKRRIKDLIKKEFPEIDSSTIPVQPSRKVFYLEYSIAAKTTTGSDNTDIVYHITVSSDHPDKSRQAELLEYFHTKFKSIFSQSKDYHFIVAYDGVSEYYCNKVYPKFQYFERQLRHLIFKVVTRAYGSVWAKETLEKDTKEKLKNNIKSIKGIKKEDLLIEQALYEMTIGQLIDYLFYVEENNTFFEMLDDNYSSERLGSMSNEELIELIEQARRKSIWNRFLAKEIKIESPVTKFKYIKEKRNNVAHCKFFYKEDYTQASLYLNEINPELDRAVENVTFIEDSYLSDVLFGLKSYLSEITQKFNQVVSPAIRALTEKLQEMTTAFQPSWSLDLSDTLKGITRGFVLPDLTSFYLSEKIQDEDVKDESESEASEEYTATNESDNKTTDKESEDNNTEQNDNNE